MMQTLPSCSNRVQLKTQPSCASVRKPVVCRAQQQQNFGQTLAAASVASLLSLATFSGAPAQASEFDILAEPKPEKSYFLDDADVLSKSTRGDINKKLRNLEIQTGLRLEVVTVRKLEFETDAFVYADKVLAGWYPTPEELNNKGMLLVVTANKEGAVTGGPAFTKAIGEELVDSIITDNIPIFTEEEKYNLTITSSIERLEARMLGTPVPEGPKRADTTRQRSYKTKEESDAKKPVYTAVVATLLLIAVVVPMLQYYGYTARD
ncbi:MAG: hypothetical protein WDW38_008597 [Sanguina aurantia]